MKTEKVELTLQNVMSVYSGKYGKCCCGCSGKHSYNSRYIDEGSKDRGYKVGADEVNDRQVQKVVNLINKATREELEAVDNGFLSLVVGERLYVAYLLKA